MELTQEMLGYSCVIFLGLVMIGGFFCVEFKIGNMTPGKIAIGTTAVILVHAALVGLVAIGVIGQ